MTNTQKSWTRKALTAFARHGKSGGAFVTKVWANGDTMVTPDNGAETTSLHAIPRHLAVMVFKNGWIVPNEIATGTGM